jgi:hypothetical protein
MVAATVPGVPTGSALDGLLIEWIYDSTHMISIDV